MINRTIHSVNGVNFVPINKEEFALTLDFPDSFSEWKNDFDGTNIVQMPEEAYRQMLAHLDNIGAQQMPPYNLQIDRVNNDFFVDLYENVEISGDKMQVTVKKFNDKNNIKSLVENTTFEYLHSKGKITDADMVEIPYVVIPNDVGSRMLTITAMNYVLTKELIDRTERVAQRAINVIEASVPIVGVGAAVRLALLLILDIATLALVIIAIRKTIKKTFELLLPPIRNYKAMTVDKLLTIGLAEHNLTYSSSLRSLFQRMTILPVPIDYKNKKVFDLILGFDDRVLNRGYPTSSDTVPTVDLLIQEICKICNINPKLDGNNLILEPKANVSRASTVVLDRNYNDQDKKNIKKNLDLSLLWNTKILSYRNDASDSLLFDNPRGLRVEYKTVPDGVPENQLTIIKGLVDIRFNFALGTIKKKTKFEEFLEDFARVSDRLLNTSFRAKIKSREGVLSVSQDAFLVTKLLHQVGGKQTSDYLSHIGSNSVYQKYHKIDESRNNLFINTVGMPVRLDNNKFNSIIPNNFVNLEGSDVEATKVVYLPELATALIDYREYKLNWSKNMKTIKVYEE